MQNPFVFYIYQRPSLLDSVENKPCIGSILITINFSQSGINSDDTSEHM